MNIAFDSHKRYTFCSVASDEGHVIAERRIDHERGALTAFLRQFAPGLSVAVEAMGSWYWIVDEIEAAGMIPQLVHARKAKLMLGCLNKTDRLDAEGLNRLSQAGTLPTVWIPPGELRDQRDLTRTRMMLRAIQTRLKNRVQAALAKYGLSLAGVSDTFGKGCRSLLWKQIEQLPVQTREMTWCQVSYVDQLEGDIARLNDYISSLFVRTKALELVQTIPGIGSVLGLVIMLEIGDVSRFPTAAQLASYAGTTPRVHASGGKVYYGRTRPDVNRYLKWAYCEAGNVITRHQDSRGWPQRHVVRLLKRVQAKKGHGKAVVAVARHLAEATWSILTKEEAYREPAS